MSDAFEEIRIPPVVGPPMRGYPPPAPSPNPPAQTRPANTHTTIVAIVVGGWLKDQTARTLQPALRAAGIHTVSPPGLDDWRAPIAALAKTALREAHPTGPRPAALALIGHSFGAQAVCNAVGELTREGIFPAFVGLIDPVSTKPGIPQPIVLDTTFHTRGGILRVYYRRFLFGPIRANIVDQHQAPLATLHQGSRRIGWTHNSMCHCDGMILELTDMLLALCQSDRER